MKVDEWLSFFKQHPEKKLFSLSDLLQLTGEQNSSLKVQLSRLVKSGVVPRCANEWYENPFSPPSAEEIAMILRLPSYLSLEYALSIHNILSQTVYRLTLVTTKLPYTFKTKSTVYEYHQINKNLYWGFSTTGFVRVAEPEKALLDLIYIRYVKSKKISFAQLSSMINDMYLEDLDTDKVHRYVQKFSPGTKSVVETLKL